MLDGDLLPMPDIDLEYSLGKTYVVPSNGPRMMHHKEKSLD